jgi:purine catabolism regulator
LDYLHNPNALTDPARRHSLTYYMPERDQRSIFARLLCRLANAARLNTRCTTWATIMAEIILSDVLAWEPRLRLPGSHALTDAELDRDVSWAVTARATAPMLPPLRGGELIILPRRIVAESGVSLPLLLREMAGHNAAAVILDGLPDGTAPLPTIVVSSSPPELEAELNRLLTERHAELYRSGTELERVLSDLATGSASLARVVTKVATALTMPLVVVEANGVTLATSITDAAPPHPASNVTGWHGERIAVRLKEGRTLWVGPVAEARRALARLVAPRIGSAVEAALARAAQARPRGPARVVAMAMLFSPMEREAAVARAIALGLPPDGTYRVAIGQRCMKMPNLVRSLAPWGSFHEAGTLDGCPAAIVEMRRDPFAQNTASSRRTAITIRVNDDLSRSSAPGWVAFSSAMTGVERLSEASREARYVAALMTANLISGSAARFESIDEIGPFRLLFPLWGTPTLADFASDVLGDLVHRDRRGILKQTLLAYLEHGGSHVEAAAHLGVHRNTLAYRLKQIANLSGRDPTDASCRLLLHLGLLATMLPADESHGTAKARE